MEQALDETERRVLGVLIEKALSQPDYYPMTSNAIVTACNQQSNRHPVMNVDEDAVLTTLEALRLRGVVTMALPAPGARTYRYKHEVEKHFDWNKCQQAIMAELLLRGPQTVGELRTRCARMLTFENLEAVTFALESLSRPESGPAMVTTMPRERGHSAIRHRHLLYPEGEAPPTAAPAKPQAAPSAPASAAAPSKNEIDALRSEINDLKNEVSDLRRRLELLENRNTSP